MAGRPRSGDTPVPGWAPVTPNHDGCQSAAEKHSSEPADDDDGRELPQKHFIRRGTVVGNYRVVGTRRVPRHTHASHLPVKLFDETAEQMDV